MIAPADAANWPLAVHSDTLCQLPPDTALRLAQHHGFSGVFWIARSEAELATVREAAVASDLAITCVAYALGTEDPVDAARAVALAADVGTEAVCVRAAPMGESYAATLDRTLRTCADFVAAASPRGLKVLVQQQWGTLAASASQLRRIVQEFDPRHLGCIYDAGSMTIEGYEDYRIGLEILDGYVADVHLASTRHFPSAQRTVWEWEWSPLNDGLLDLQKLLRALRRGGYRGWLTIADRIAGVPVEKLLESDREMLLQAAHDFEGIGSHNPCRPLDDHVALAERARRADVAPLLVADARA